MITLRPTHLQFNALIADYDLQCVHLGGIETYSSKCETLYIQVFARLEGYLVIFVNPAMYAVIDDNNYLEII